MIYLITGVPGSGKSLYAISTLLKELLAQKIKKNGKPIQRRLMVDGVSNLVMPHELMAPGTVENDGSVIPTEDGDGIWNWPDWCKPGDIIFVDEVQRWWRPRGNGVKPPRDIKALETHRHMGVDFVIVTQNPMLIDQNVRRLVGRHINVRRMFGGARAVLYDWDSCSADVSRVANANKKFWSYPKDAYKLYHSSELHTKQKQTIPLWLVVPAIALIAGIFVLPKAYNTFSGAVSGRGISSSAAPDKTVKPEPVVIASAKEKPASEPLPESVPPLAPPSVRPLGCINMGSRCSCFDQAGLLVKLPIEECRDGSRTTGYILPPFPDRQALGEKRVANSVNPV